MTVTVVQSLMILIILLLIDHYICTKGVRIVSQWCSTPYTEAKETLDSVHICFSFLNFMRWCFPSYGVFRFNPPPLYITPDHPHPPPLPPLPSTFLLPGKLPTFTTTTTTSPPMTLAYYPPPHIGPESVTSKYIARPYSAFAKCRFLLAQTPLPLSLPLLRCTTTLCPSSAMEATPSVTASPGIRNLKVPIPFGG